MKTSKLVACVAVLLAVFLAEPTGAAPTKPRAKGEARASYVAGEVLVKFKRSARAAERARLHERGGATVLSVIPELRVDRIKIHPSETLENALDRYRQNPLVEYAEANFLVHSQNTPNDPRFADQWGLHNVGQFSGTVDADVDAPEAWDVATGSSQVVVAVVDSGRSEERRVGKECRL